MRNRLFIILIGVISLIFSYNVYARPMNVIVYTESGRSEYQLEPVTLQLNGSIITNLTMPAVNLLGTTYVPLREVMAPMGAEVGWNDAQKEARIAFENKLIVVRLNNKTADVNGAALEMPAPPRLMNEKTMVPLRFIAEAMDFDVNWYHDEWKATIDSIKPIVAESVPEQPIIDDEPTVTHPATETPTTTETPPVNEISSDVSEYKPYSETEIRTLTLPDKNGEQIYTIGASSRISGVTEMTLSDNRLVVDILNAKMNLPQSVYYTEAPYCVSVRAGQFQTEPEKIARVVFDLTAEVNYEVYLSDDETAVYVKFNKDLITDVNFRTDGVSDYITITGARMPSLSVFRIADPERLVIDALNSEINFQMNEPVKGVFSSALRTGQFNESVARIVVDLTGQAAFDISYEGDSATICLSETTYKNIWYENDQRRIVIRRESGLTGNMLQLTDKYYDGKYMIELPADFTAVLGTGDYYVNDAYIKSLQIYVANGRTVIDVNENKILAAEVTEDASYIYIKFVMPREKYDKIVMIDPGHGGSQPGTQGYGMLEKDINLVISNYLMEMLDADDTIKAYATRTKDVYMGLEERAELANEYADFFVSIHNNYFEKNFSVNGTEVHYYPHDNDGVIGISSQTAASIMSRNLISVLNSYDRKTFKSEYVVLAKTMIPAVLCEIGFLSNEEDAKKLASDSYRRKTAEALYKGIVEVFSNYTPRR